MDKPKIRQVEVFPIEDEEKKISILITDPDGLSDEIFQLPGTAMIILGMMDGEHTIEDIQTEVMRSFGVLLYSEAIEELVRKLDEYHLLENENFFGWRKQIVDNFLSSPTRVPKHVGLAYPSDKAELQALLDKFFADEHLPKEPYRKQPLALIAPHIDINRGAFSFAASYRTLKTVKPPATFFVFGTSHFGMENPFAITSKHFETPLGTLENATDITGNLAKQLPWLVADEFSHRREHSIEFQTLFLKYLFDDSDIRMVPVLCNGFHSFMLEGKDPKDDSKIKEAINAFSEAFKRAENPVLIAGADLSHIGPRFGDRVQISEELLKWIRDEDLNMLKLIAQIDSNGFFSLISQEKDRRKICGLPPIWTVMKLLPEETRGVLLSYQQSFEPQTGSVVSFGAMAFHSVEDVKDVKDFDTSQSGEVEENH
jgi:AmmeMemoRadiSam system protein B